MTTSTQPAPFQLPIEGAEGSPSHLAVCLSRPQTAPDTDTAVLYMHGFGSHQQGDKAHFFRQRFMDAGLAFCSFDFQSHGDSGGDFLDLTLTRNVRDIGQVHRYLRCEGFRRLVLFGSSMGGASALWYAALHPQDIAASLHIAPALELDQGLMRLFDEEERQRWRRDGQITLHHTLVTCELSWRLIEDLQSYDLDRLAGLFKTPTLIFQGKNDTSVDWRAVVDFAASSPAESIAMHLMMDGDHRLLNRLDRMWVLAHQFLEELDLV